MRDAIGNLVRIGDRIVLAKGFKKLDTDWRIVKIESRCIIACNQSEDDNHTKSFTAKEFVVIVPLAEKMVEVSDANSRGVSLVRYYEENP